jgi:hypothetical protein
MSTLPFQGGIIFRTFAPDSGFGTYAMLTALQQKIFFGITLRLGYQALNYIF